MSVQDKLYVFLHNAQKFDALLDKKALGQYLRRGVVDSAILNTREYLAELMTEISDALYKFNENHDPDNGRFTSGDGVSVTIVPPSPKPSQTPSESTPRGHEAHSEPGGKSKLNLVNAMKKLNTAGTTSQGKCATSVREALDVGGVRIHPRINYAKDYGPALEAHGFVKLTNPRPAPNYRPKMGDVVVIQNHPRGVDKDGNPYPAGNIAGHIAMYNGAPLLTPRIFGLKRDHKYVEGSPYNGGFHDWSAAEFF